MAIVLADLLEEDRVTLEVRAQSRDEALREIVGTMGGAGAVEETAKFLAEVRAREEVHTTFMGNGVAFPHSRTALVSTIVLGIGRSRAGVPFGEKGELAHLIFVVGVPQRMVKDYLVCVGALARLTKDDENRAALMSSATPNEFVTLLREASLLLE
ncbi:MAG: PTS sugar transporter subunit IIA [Chthoniobacterales bacterium]|nr:PTS sugar transporter subunit IIA [Chthoniobacterales bacterium]